MKIISHSVKFLECWELLYHNPTRSFTQEETEAQRIDFLLKVTELVSDFTPLFILF